jgi:hypothetical protein
LIFKVAFTILRVGENSGMIPLSHPEPIGLMISSQLIPHLLPMVVGASDQAFLLMKVLYSDILFQNVFIIE